MPPHESFRGTAEEWLARSRSNLAIATAAGSAAIFREDLCFNAQQAAEKAFKAVLTGHNIPFRYVHDLQELMVTLTQHGVAVPDEVQMATILTPYAVALRYPGHSESVSEDEYQEAIKLATIVLRWAEGRLQRS
jgi:HEPN domain-containing protein